MRVADGADPVTDRLDALYCDVDSSLDTALAEAQADALREEW